MGKKMTKTRVKPSWLLLGGYYLYLLVVWGFFRYTIRLDDALEELVMKPVIWLAPLVYVFLADKKKMRLFDGKVTPAIVWGVLVGSIFLFANAVAYFSRNKGWSMPPEFFDYIGIGFITATIEEVVFSGFVFGSLLAWTKKPFASIAIASGMFALIHIPIGLFVYQYTIPSLVIFMGVAGLISLVSNYLFYKTNNIAAPILSHWFWIVAVSIFG